LNLAEFEKSTPAHVKAAIAYNRLLKFYDCPFKYEPLRDGDKTKWVYLKANPLNLDGCAFKGYDDPKEIKDFITQYIDYDRIFEAELESKLDDFYSALGWEKVTAETKKAAEFFSF